MKPVQLTTGEWLKYNFYFLMEHLMGHQKAEEKFGKGKKALYSKIGRRLSPNGVEHVEDIPELFGEDPEADWKEFQKLKNGPVVFRNAAGNWPATQKWDLDFFEREYGDEEIILNDLVGTIDPNNPQKFQVISLREYIGMMRSGSLKYLKFSSLVQKKQKLRDDLDQAFLDKFVFPLSFGKTFYMFIGGNGSITPLHNEFPSVVYVQVSGRKRWVMYLPEDRFFLDPRTERRIYFYSNVVPGTPNPKDYPLQSEARKLEFILEPGDVLWFPPFAWHYIENLSESIGVSYKFANFGAGMRSSRMLTSLFLMATRPNPFYAFIASRLKKDDYTLTKKEEEYK